MTARPAVGLLVNKASHRQEAQHLADKLTGHMRKFLRVDPRRWGYVVRDAHVPLAVNRGQPFVLEYPQCPASLCLERILPRVLGGGSAAVGGGLLGRFSSLFR